MSKPYVVALFGAAGRMGREILKQAPQFADLRLNYAYNTAQTGEKIETLIVQAPPAHLPENVRAVIDFSAASVVLNHLEMALEARSAYVCGVTGLTQEIMNELRAAGNEIPVLHSPNMAAGMNLMFHLAALTAKALPDYVRHIEEIHHAGKKDAPSGTALRLRDSIADATGEDTEITALRMGDVIGEHHLVFGGPGERLEITHRADSRAVFAIGALRAATWLLDHRYPGFFGMKDVLGL